MNEILLFAVLGLVLLRWDGMPLGANVDTTFEHPEGFLGDVEEMRSRRGLNEGDTYVAWGSKSRATSEQLLDADTAYPEWVASRYLQLPKDVPPRVAFSEYVEIAHAFYDQGEQNFVNSVLDRVARQSRSAELAR